MKVIGIIAKRHQPLATELAGEIRGWLLQRDVEVVLEQDLAAELGGVQGYP